MGRGHGLEIEGVGSGKSRPKESREEQQRQGGLESRGSQARKDGLGF